MTKESFWEGRRNIKALKRERRHELCMVFMNDLVAWGDWTRGTITALLQESQMRMIITLLMWFSVIGMVLVVMDAFIPGATSSPVVQAVTALVNTIVGYILGMANRKDD